jgi:hypothetical protein
MAQVGWVRVVLIRPSVGRVCWEREAICFGLGWFWDGF